MAEVIGFVNASDEETKLASSLSTIWSGMSPFQEGVKLTISDSAFKKTELFEFKTKTKSTSDRPRPALITSVGVLFIRMLSDDIDIKGNKQEATGDLNKFVRDLGSNPNIHNDGEALKAIVEWCKDKTFVVHRGEPFRKLSYTGREMQKSLVNVDIVAE